MLLQTTSFHHSNALACVAAATWNTLSPPSLPVRLPLTPRCSPAGGWADRVLHSPDPCVCHLVSVLLTPSLDWLLMGRGYLIVWCHQPRMHSVQRLGESLEEDSQLHQHLVTFMMLGGNCVRWLIPCPDPNETNKHEEQQDCTNFSSVKDGRDVVTS